MNTQLVKQTQNAIVSFTPEQKDLIKKTVADKATDLELELFLHLASSYNLDPFKKEIWFIKYSEKDKPQIYTSRDGYLKIAHASGVFNGMESYTIDDDKGNPIKAVCKVYRKDMDRPFSAEIKISEYKQNSPTWNKFPSAMGIKVAEVFALKRAFSVNGLVSSEELPETASYHPPLVHNNRVKDEWETTEYISEAQRKRLFAIAKGKDRTYPAWEDNQIKDYLADLKIQSSAEIPKELYEHICDVLAGAPFHIDLPGQVKLEVANDNHQTT